MKIEKFAYVHDSIYINGLRLFKDFESWQDLKSKIENTFENQTNNLFFSNNVFDQNLEVPERTATLVWFNTTLKNKENQDMWIHFELNTRVTSNAPKWYCKFFHSTSDMMKNALKSKFPVIGDILFNDFNSINMFLDAIKEKTQEEEWQYKNYNNFTIKLPILKSYLEHTTTRLKEENKIVRSSDCKHIIFNSGLLEKNFLLDLNIQCEVKIINILVSIMKHTLIPCWF